MLYKSFLSNCPLLTALPSTKASHSFRKIKSSWQKGWLFVVPWCLPLLRLFIPSWLYGWVHRASAEAGEAVVTCPLACCSNKLKPTQAKASPRSCDVMSVQYPWSFSNNSKIFTYLDYSRKPTKYYLLLFACSAFLE